MGLGEASPKIYKNMQVEGKMLAIAKADVASILQPLEQYGFRWSAETNKLKRHVKRVLSYETPWCHTRHLIGKHCSLDHQLTFNIWGAIHPRCMSCWKTVLAPKNFDELMIWKKVQENEIGFACKCGIELRDYTPRHYGAYHYAPSIDEGQEQHAEVKRLARKYLSKKTANSVILKRGCTEYEMIKGPSAYWHLSDQDEEILEYIENYVDEPITVKTQEKFIQNYVIMRWLLWAHMNGDISYMKYNGGKELFPHAMTYHDKNLAEIKHDLGVCHAQAKEQLAPELSTNFLLTADKFARLNKITLDKLGPTLGYNLKTPYGTIDLETLQKDVPEEEKGEDIN